MSDQKKPQHNIPMLDGRKPEPRPQCHHKWYRTYPGTYKCEDCGAVRLTDPWPR